MFSIRTRVGWLLLTACTLTGCAVALESGQAATATWTATPGATAAPTTTAAPTLEPTVRDQISLVIWLPDDLLPVEDEALSTLLDSEISEFMALEDNIRIDVRRKTSQDVGGIMSTLRTASSVAPGALPDLTLMRREDLLIAVEAGLIQPLEGRIATAVIADLFPSALRLGSAEDQLFGLPYLLDLYLYAFRPADSDETPVWTFDAVVEHDQTIALPALRPNGVADILWLQYIASGGASSADGTVQLTPGAVSDVLEFYERLAGGRLIASGTDEFTSPSDYMAPLADGRIDSGIINTGILRGLADAEPPLAYSAIPTADGSPVTLVDGWVWVMVTSNAERQVLAGRFLNWIMESGRHSAYAQAIRMPPSLQSSLRRWHVDGIDNALLIALLADAPPPQPDIGTSAAARALQSAWLGVITGEMSATEATEAALEP